MLTKLPTAPLAIAALLEECLRDQVEAGRLPSWVLDDNFGSLPHRIAHGFKDALQLEKVHPLMLEEKALLATYAAALFVRQAGGLLPGLSLEARRVVQEYGPWVTETLARHEMEADRPPPRIAT